MGKRFVNYKSADFTRFYRSLWKNAPLYGVLQKTVGEYTALWMGGRPNDYPTDIDRQAEEMFFQLVKDYAQRQGITERLKTENQMEWVGRMNNCKAQAEEVIMAKLIMISEKCGVIPAFLNNSTLHIAKWQSILILTKSKCAVRGVRSAQACVENTVFKNISKTL